MSLIFNPRCYFISSYKFSFSTYMFIHRYWNNIFYTYIGIVKFIYLISLFFHRISPEGVDIVLDCLCGEECNKGYALLKPMGKYILYGSSNVVTGETKSFFSAARSVRQQNNLTFFNFSLILILFKWLYFFFYFCIQEIIFSYNNYVITRFYIILKIVNLIKLNMENTN